MTCQPASPAPLSLDAQRLVEQWRFLPRRVYRKLSHRSDVRLLGPDDAEGAGIEGLCLAAAKFDPARGVAFTTFAFILVAQAITAAARAWARRSVVSLDIPNADGETIASEIPAPQGLDVGDAIDARDAVATLPDRERRIIAQRNGGRTLREVGAEIGLSRERIRQIEQCALRRLKDVLA